MSRASADGIVDDVVIASHALWYILINTICWETCRLVSSCSNNYYSKYFLLIYDLLLSYCHLPSPCTIQMSNETSCFCYYSDLLVSFIVFASFDRRFFLYQRTGFLPFFHFFTGSQEYTNNLIFIFLERFLNWE